MGDLHKAAFVGSVERTISLLSEGSIGIDELDKHGQTPLMDAAIQGHVTVAGILVSRGANVSIASAKGFTALHMAAQSGHVGVTEVLMKAGADLEAKDTWEGPPLFTWLRIGGTGSRMVLLGGIGEVPLAAAAGGGGARAAARNRRIYRDPRDEFYAPLSLANFCLEERAGGGGLRGVAFLAALYRQSSKK
eukprot:g12978.t1